MHHNKYVNIFEGRGTGVLATARGPLHGENKSDHPTPHICKTDAPKRCHTLGVRMA